MVSRTLHLFSVKSQYVAMQNLKKKLVNTKRYVTANHYVIIQASNKLAFRDVFL